MLILARHGNTVRPGEKAVWGGGQTDLPLVDEGMAQARRAADYLTRQQLVPTRVITGPTCRTRMFGTVIAQRLGLELQTDERLREINYGSWEGLTSSEVAERFGAEEFIGWVEHLRWPARGAWGEGLREVQQRIRAVLSDVRSQSEKSHVMLVTSNGFIRIVYSLVLPQESMRNAKVPTGGLCLLRPAPRPNCWTVDMWNIDPSSDLGSNQGA